MQVCHVILHECVSAMYLAAFHSHIREYCGCVVCVVHQMHTALFAHTLSSMKGLQRFLRGATFQWNPTVSGSQQDIR